MLSYAYYRSYCFFQKNGLAFNPHNYAVNTPTVIQVFLLNLTYLLLVKTGSVELIADKNLWVYPVGVVILYTINDKYFSDRIAEYKRKWKNEPLNKKLIKGILIAIFVVCCFISLFVIPNELHKLRKQ